MKLISCMPILHKNGFMAFLVVVVDMKSGQLMLTCYELIFGMPILHKNRFMAFLVVVVDMKSGQLMLTCYEVNIWYVDPTQKWIYGIPCCCSGYGG